MSKIRQRNKHLIYAGLAGAAIMGIIFAGYVIYNMKLEHNRRANLKQEYQQEIKVLKDAQIEQERSMISGFMSARNIEPGQTIASKDLIAVKLPGLVAPDNLINNPQVIVGSSSKIELHKGTPLTKAMFNEGQMTPPDLRNKELNEIMVPTDLKKGDVIDVRIQFPTGQDFIILSKKKIEDLLSPTMWITLSEAEILSLSSAMVDALLHEASLYALTYVEPEMQDRAIPTYPVNKEVLKLMASDPNIVNKAEKHLTESVRTALERDLAALNPSQSRDTSVISETVPTYSYQSSSRQPNVESNLYEESSNIDNGTQQREDILSQNAADASTFTDVQEKSSP
ncbi:SAF domain-containing protein [Paenibacillus sp. IHBB 10380]|uniref:SAF domain-containing protein n=1 Tax=Paenibacillus sp. IHBB 10380 TaxID=1566358 RepID=UPI0005CF9B80|nr:SAF domain-containing protein [Paenibacillus sp. IHBB 10380]